MKNWIGNKKIIGDFCSMSKCDFLASHTEITEDAYDEGVKLVFSSLVDNCSSMLYDHMVEYFAIKPFTVNVTFTTTKRVVVYAQTDDEAREIADEFLDVGKIEPDFDDYDVDDIDVDESTDYDVGYYEHYDKDGRRYDDDDE